MRQPVRSLAIHKLVKERKPGKGFIESNQKKEQER